MKLEDFLEERELQAELFETTGEVKTVEDAAEEVGVENDHIIKSLVFFVNKEPILVIGCGGKNIDEEKLKEVFETDEVRIASPVEVEEMTGYSIGEVPPVGVELSKVIEEEVLEKEKVYGGGGSVNHLLEIDPSDLIEEDTEVASIQ